MLWVRPGCQIRVAGSYVYTCACPKLSAKGKPEWFLKEAVHSTLVFCWFAHKSRVKPDFIGLTLRLYLVWTEITPTVIVLYNKTEP